MSKIQDLKETKNKIITNTPSYQFQKKLENSNLLRTEDEIDPKLIEVIYN
jgi:hypothetical protein